MIFLPAILLVLTVCIVAKEREKFYIYDWKDLTNRYANHSDRGHVSHGVEFPYWMLNHGTGRYVNKTYMEHKTSQFSLFKIMYERALLDKRRTLDPTKAKSFLIPFDLGMHASFMETNGRMRRTGCPLAKDVVSRLSQSHHFQAKFGHDHTLVISINQNMNYFLGAPKCIELLKLCWNCTKLSIDEYLFTAQDRKFELRNKGINWHAIPFPSDYHYSPAVSTLPPWMVPPQSRSIHVSFVGNSKRFNEVSTLIREALIVQCNRRPTQCVHGDYQHDAQHSLNHISRRSVFCLQPPGDMPTRKSVFDTILSGCIPVLFHPLTSRYMYEWHWGQQVWDEVAISFDSLSENQQLIDQSVDFVNKLVEMVESNSTDIERRQARIREIAFNLQYSLIHTDPTTNASIVAARGPQGERDAYDITMDHILAIHYGRAWHARSSHYVSCRQIGTKHSQKEQTADFCNSTHSTQDPYYPASLVTLSTL